MTKVCKGSPAVEYRWYVTRRAPKWAREANLLDRGDGKTYLGPSGGPELPRAVVNTRMGIYLDETL
jgi:hypothetical protein